MGIHTLSQKLAQAAYKRISVRAISDKYKTFSKKFPALIHTCGLAQAIAFGMAKKENHDYLDDLAVVLQSLGHQLKDPAELDKTARELHLGDYIRLSRDAINAASWLKRYVEAVSPDSEEIDE